MFPRIPAFVGLALTALASFAAGAGADIVDSYALDAAPERIGYQPPVYPAALATGDAPVAVDVRMTLVIARDGTVQTIEAIHSPRPEFVAPARAAVERWQFQPGFVNGVPHAYRLRVTVPFRPPSGVALDVKPANGSGADGLAMVSEPTIKWETAPAYPAELADQPKDGVAVVNVLVDALGTPSDPVAEYASHPAFAVAATEAVLGWQFTSGEREGTLVSTRTHVLVRFRKEDAGLSAADRKRSAQLDYARSYDVAPDALIQVPLVYPYDALIKGERGMVSLNLLVSPEGQIESIEADPGARPEFILAASACVSCWTFHPAMKNDQPVFGVVKWQLVFTEDSGELQFDDVARELLAALRAGTFKSALNRELDKPVTPRERMAPKLPPGLGPAAAGDAIIEVIVDRNGRAQFPRIVSAPTPAVGYAAATAARRWRFDPPRRGGVPVDIRVKIPFRITVAPDESASAPGASNAPAAGE